MKVLEMADAVAPLAQYAQNVGEEPVVLTIDGKPVAALFSVDESDWETLALSTHPQFKAIIEQSRTRQKREGGVSSEEMRRRFDL